MPRRKTLLVGGALGVLLLLAATKLAAPFDLGRFRSQIEAAASSAARLEVTIHGEIVLSRWLPLEVVVHDLRLRVRDDELAKIPSVTLSALELTPLFRKQLRMGAAELEGPVITVVKGADGRFNFEREPGNAPHPVGARPGEPALVADRLIVRGGKYLYEDRRTSGDKAQLEGIEADVRDFTIAPTGGKFLERLSLAGTFRCATARKGNLAMTHVRSPITAARGRFVFPALSVDIFDGTGEGTFTAEVGPAAPRYEITLDVPRCRVERLLEGLDKRRLLGGEAALEVHFQMAGRNKHELARSLSGEVSLRGDDLVSYEMDVDELIAKFEKTRRFSLIDLGSFFIAGPLGTVATKGYDFARVYKEARGGEGAIERLVATWTIKDGIAQAEDCALATKRYRVAFAGRIDLPQESYQDAVVAVLDDRGCSRFSQKLTGPVANRTLLTLDKLQKLTGPFVGLFQRIRAAFAPNAPCEVFYSGSVPQPPEAPKPLKRSSRPRRKATPSSA